MRLRPLLTVSAAAIVLAAQVPIAHPVSAATCTTQASVCEIGDTGPGGGLVFLTPKSKGNKTGKFFEVAQAKWSPVRTRRPLCEGPVLVPGTQSRIGAGKKNTRMISETPGCESGAAADVLGYEGGGFNDWFLPSSNELNEIWKRLVKPLATKEDLTGPGSNDFLSSTDYPGGSGEYIRFQYMKTGRESSGKRGGIMKYQYSYNYWPVRMFTLPPAPKPKPQDSAKPTPKPDPVFN